MVHAHGNVVCTTTGTDDDTDLIESYFTTFLVDHRIICDRGLFLSRLTGESCEHVINVAFLVGIQLLHMHYLRAT